MCFTPDKLMFDNPLFLKYKINGMAVCRETFLFINNIMTI